jgi:hypothetical protein
VGFTGYIRNMKINRRTFLKNLTGLLGGGQTATAGYGYVTKIEPERFGC